jgi:hypothetical protein
VVVRIQHTFSVILTVLGIFAALVLPVVSVAQTLTVKADDDQLQKMINTLENFLKLGNQLPLSFRNEIERIISELKTILNSTLTSAERISQRSFAEADLILENTINSAGDEIRINLAIVQEMSRLISGTEPKIFGRTGLRYRSQLGERLRPVLIADKDDHFRYAIVGAHLSRLGPPNALARTAGSSQVRVQLTGTSYFYSGVLHLSAPPSISCDNYSRDGQRESTTTPITI